jgi:hypothetical protein
MKLLRWFGALLAAGVLTAACADAPTAPDAASVAGAVPGRDVTLDPVIVIGEPDPGCDPYLTLGGCDDGGGECMMSDPGVTGPEETGLMGCSGSGGTGSGSDGAGGTGGSGGSTGSPGTLCPDYGCEEETTAYEQGPLAWGACVLAVLGSVYTIDQVAGAFEDWWVAQREYDSVKRMYDAVVANPESVSPETIQLWEFRLTYARDRKDAAISAVSEKTGGSYWALAGAGVACGIAAVLPTP